MQQPRHWIISFTLLAASTHAQTLNWYKPSLPSIPPASVGASLAYNPVAHLTLMFGGTPGTGARGDTWTFSNQGWIKLAPAISPPARWGAMLAYDASSGVTVLFGGEGADGVDLADTWTWDGTTWTQQVPAVSPRARDNGAMAYHPATGMVVLFGGEGRNGGGGGNGGEIFADTWVWNGRQSTWTRKFPAASPSARRSSLVYDEASRALVLYGGDNAAGDCCDTYYNDTWTWNGITWTKLQPPDSPPARALPAVAYDSSIGQIVMFGGYNIPGSGLRDTWTWNGTTWAERQTTFSPPGCWESGAAYDPALKALVLFGGELTGDSTSGETWLAIP